MRLPFILKLARIAGDGLSWRAVVNNFLKEWSYTHGRLQTWGKPMVFELETTNQCPYTCIMCPRTKGMTRAKGHMDFDLFRSIIDQMRPEWQVEFPSWPPRPIVRLLHYGEPTLYKHFAESITYCHNRGFQVMISSNPSAWTHRRMEDMLDTGLDDLLAMIDGMDDDTSMAIRGKAASFERGKSNLLKLAEMKSRRGLKTPHLIVSMVKQERNAHQWEEFQNYWHGIAGIDQVNLAHFSTFAGDQADLKEQAEALADKDPDQDAQMARQSYLRVFRCYYPWHSVSITWNGKVVPCCRDYNESLVLGDLTQESLQEIWNGPRMQSLRGEFLRGRITSRLCQECKEPSLEIGLPGFHYPPAAWLRMLGYGRIAGAGRHAAPRGASFVGPQNSNK